MTQRRIKPLLVTGSPRSGTTWIGCMLAGAPEVYYVNEPFNPHVNLRDYGSPRVFDRHFTYVTEQSERPYHAAIEDIVHGKYRLRYGLTGIRSIGGARKAFKRWRHYRQHRRELRVPIIKDPIALLSAEWLARRFDLRVIVTVRHPAAVIASMKRLGWGAYPNRWALPQPRLMQDLLWPFEAELRHLEQRPCDIIEHNALQWRMLHYVIAKFRRRHPDWLFVRHEDVSLDPSESFAKLYKGCNLTLTDTARATIAAHSSASNPARAQGQEKPLKLNSVATRYQWQNLLEPREISRIRALVEDVSREFYSDEDWRCDREITARATRRRGHRR